MTAPIIDGDIVEVGRDRLLLVDNASAGAITVTVQTPGTVQGLAIAESAVNVPAGALVAIALDAGVYGRTSDLADGGRAYVDYSAVASVTRAVLER